MSALPKPNCPICRADLVLEADDELNAWVCPGGHGLAFTLTEAYERLQGDEIHEIWQRARDARPGSRGCPMCSATMARIAVSPDADEVANDMGTTAGPDSVTLDVCLVDELFWFDAGELDALPPDLPDAAPDPQENAAIAAVTKQFGDRLAAGWNDEERQTLTGRLSGVLIRSRTTSTVT